MRGKENRILIWLLTVSMIQAALFFLPSDAHALRTQAVCSEETVLAGESLELTVRISDNPGLAAWMFELAWDTDALALDQGSSEPVRAGNAFTSGTLLFKKTDKGIRVSWYNSQNISKDGDMFYLKLIAKAGASGTCPIEIRCTEKNTINENEQMVSVATVNGKVTIENPNKDAGPPVNDDPAAREDAKSLSFKDVQQSDYYYDAVRWAVDSGITNGTTETTFSPTSPCTRAQSVTFLWRAAGSPEPKSGTTSFTDLIAGSYYYKAVLWAVEEGITNGTTATTFSPDATVTRAQVVTFLWRANKVGAKGNNAFEDVTKGQYYYDAVAWAAENHITNGTSATTFSPNMDCNRGQIVTFLYRAK